MQDVKTNRNKYIGGSDIPVIMGISPFRERFDLLLEKAELEVNDFEGNEYTEYGNVMEEKIRNYINAFTKRNFVEGEHIHDDIRVHTDGEDEEMILEIKTTSQIHDNVNDYKIYLVQLLFYMQETNKKKGILAVYNRPEDFDEKFDSDRLQTFYINIEDYDDLLEKINKAVKQFRIDLAKLKENPFLTEADLVPTQVSELSIQLEELESKLVAYNELVKKYDKFKEDLRLAMNEYGMKKWITPKGSQITLVLDTPDKEVEEEFYDEDKFIAENPELYEKYHNKLAEYMETKTIIKKGKKGYVKITLPKTDKEDTKNE